MNFFFLLRKFSFLRYIAIGSVKYIYRHLLPLEVPDGRCLGLAGIIAIDRIAATLYAYVVEEHGMWVHGVNLDGGSYISLFHCAYTLFIVHVVGHHFE